MNYEPSTTNLQPIFSNLAPHNSFMAYTFLYLDPGSGSYLLQVIIAAILGGLMFFKNFWIKIKSFFVKPKPKEEEIAEQEEEQK
jgi:hypothetical protein